MSQDAKPCLGGAGRLDELKGKVGEIRGLLGALEEARSSAKRTRGCLVVVLLLVIFCFGWIIYETIRSFDNVAFLTKLQEHMLVTATDTLDQVGPLLTRVAPVYQRELEKQYAEHRDDMQAKLQAEVDTFQDNVVKLSKTRLEDRLDKLANRQGEKLKKHFPELMDPKKLDIALSSLEGAMAVGVSDVLEHRVEKAVQQIARVHESATKFLPEDRQKGFDERVGQVWDDFLTKEAGKVEKTLKPLTGGK
ncbi:MAG: hypothetical protein FJ279_27545 [Planctomycetes bacterium]|nr:hypothetical protein [Planctomycetota bacterium]